MIKQIIKKLGDAGGIYVVGGVVRDRLLGRETSDYDFITPSHPEKLAKEIAHKFNGSSFPLDKERGVFRVTFRNEEIHLDLAQRQGKTLEDDLNARDFSINALAVPASKWLLSSWKKSIIDLSKGQTALASKKITPISKKSFPDDPLRLLRAFRLMAELEFTLPAETIKQISLHAAKIKKSAGERVRDEFLRIFQTPRAYQTLLQMEKAGLLDAIFPEAKTLRKTAPGYYGKGGVLKHTLESVEHFEDVLQNLRSWFGAAAPKVAEYLKVRIGGYPRTAHCKWALLLHDIGKPATAKMIKGRLRFFEHEHIGADMVPKLAQRYRWSGDESSRYARMVRNHMRPGNLATQPEVTDKAISRFFRDLDEDAIAMLLVSLGDHLTYLSSKELKARATPHEKITRMMVKRYYDRPEQVMPKKIITGHDVMKAFKLQPSPLIGRMLEDVKDHQAEGAIRNKEEALAFLSKRLSTYQS